MVSQNPARMWGGGPLVIDRPIDWESRPQAGWRSVALSDGAPCRRVCPWLYPERDDLAYRFEAAQRSLLRERKHGPGEPD